MTKTNRNVGLIFNLLLHARPKIKLFYSPMKLLFCHLACFPTWIFVQQPLSSAYNQFLIFNLISCQVAKMLSHIETDMPFQEIGLAFSSQRTCDF